jgi:hypothetical protein
MAECLEESVTKNLCLAFFILEGLCVFNESFEALNDIGQTKAPSSNRAAVANTS